VKIEELAEPDAALSAADGFLQVGPGVKCMNQDQLQVNEQGFLQIFSAISEFCP
jgi:hypothetical protein